MSDGGSDAGQQDGGQQQGQNAGDGDRGGQQQNRQDPPDAVTLTQSQIDSIVEKRLAQDRRQDRWSDPEYLKSIADRLKDNDELKKLIGVGEQQGKAGNRDDAIRQARQEWEEQALKPVKTQLESSQERIQELTRRDLHRQIVQHAARVGVKKALLTAPTEGADPPVVHMFEGVFQHDPETDRHFVRKGDGYAYSAKPSENGPPYKGPGEFFDEWAQRDEAKELLEPRTRQGADYRGNTGGGSRVVTVEDFKKMDSLQRRALYQENPELYRELMSEKRRAGEQKLRQFG